jgi:hypothetical protein
MLVIASSMSRHDLPGLAVAALRNVERRPCFLHGMRGRGRQALDGDDPVGRLYVGDPDRAGALHLIVDVHGAGAALRNAASIFGAGETDLLADHPKERGVRLDLHVADIAIDAELSHERPLRLCSKKIALCFCCRWFAGSATTGKNQRRSVPWQHNAPALPCLWPYGCHACPSL